MMADVPQCDDTPYRQAICPDEDTTQCWRWCGSIEQPRRGSIRSWTDLWEWAPECAAEGW